MSLDKAGEQGIWEVGAQTLGHSTEGEAGTSGAHLHLWTPGRWVLSTVL